MKSLLFSLGICLGTVDAISSGVYKLQRLNEAVPAHDVPGYTATLPVDHFTSSNKQTFQNRFFVNDTYYKPGGPVILYDNGEAQLDPATVAAALAEAGVSASAPMRLAAKLNGLVVGWEHRYYGFSQPVAMNDQSGHPADGEKGYDYLKIEQALEDVAYFANNFNKTTLPQNSVVTNEDLKDLGPSRTPWIFIGGSYPGARAAWARIKYPDVFFASWASSAPVQTIADGSLYYSPILRTLPPQCAVDVKAAIKYADETLAGGSAKALERVKTGVFLATTPGDLRTNVNNLTGANSLSEFDVGGELADGITGEFQYLGPARTTGIMCKFMESFDVKSFRNKTSMINDIKAYNLALFSSPLTATPAQGGIAAQCGSDAGACAFAAFVYGIYRSANLEKSPSETGSDGNSTATVDGQSWSWQSLTQAGYYEGSDPTNVSIISKFYNITSYRDIGFVEEAFGDFPASSIPKDLDNKGLLAMGGWNMQPSNVMFTNGEFDPWRSFSVASIESQAGAPGREVVQTVPKCNQSPDGSQVFGLVYPGAVHAEDIFSSGSSAGNSTNGQPLDQGLDLFLKAWQTWQPCFKKN